VLATGSERTLALDALKQGAIKMARRILPIGIKNSLFHFSYHLAPSEFDRFAYLYGFAPNMRFGLERLKHCGFHANSIIDVGAYQGKWSMMAKSIWPGSSLYMVEPNAAKEPECRAVAETLGAKLFEKLLGALDGQEVEFNVMASGSSIMSERSPLPRIVEKHKLTSLDSLIGQVKGPALLKIDAQGYELEILKGARLILKDVEAVLLEISIIEINEGAPLLDDVLVFMKELGFVTYDILELHRRPLDGALNQVDVIFVRESSSLVSDKRHFSL
jgi:FkbM family methyltransferase